MTADPFFGDEADLRDDETVDRATDSEEAQSQPEFSSVYEFVEEHLTLLYQRNWQETSRTWCPRWFEHPEAVSRLEAVWRAFESLRLDPTLGMSVWWRDHLDPHMAVLTDPSGPMAGCSMKNGHASVVAPMEIEVMSDGPLREAMSVYSDDDQ